MPSQRAHHDGALVSSIAPAKTALVRARDLTKIHPGRGGSPPFLAVDAIEFEIEQGEAFGFLGPNGAGKSSTMRMIGCVSPRSSGSLEIFGLDPDRDGSRIRARLGVVPQEDALDSELTVTENCVVYGRYFGLSKSLARERSQRLLAFAQLEEKADQRVDQLSGGQRQRVAMGRAIVREPSAFLMDEPLSNLDAKLRVQVRAEIHSLQRASGVTTIYVTHDQTEAMTMGDRIAVLRDGALQQVDTPERVYQRPANQFVAGFIGSPAMNIVDARLTRTNGSLVASFGDHSLEVDNELVAERPALLAYEGKDVVLGIRPEDLEDAAFVAEVPPGRTLEAVCSLREALGSEELLHFPVAAEANAGEPIGLLDGENAMLLARVDPQSKMREGDRLRLVADTKRLHFFDPVTGRAIYADPRQVLGRES